MSATTFKVMVHDIGRDLGELVLREREVDVPRLCPSCGADFKEKPLTVEAWRKQYHSAFLNEDDSLDRRDHYDGEESIHVSYTCGCGELLAESQETRS